MIIIAWFFQKSKVLTENLGWNVIGIEVVYIEIKICDDVCSEYYVVWYVNQFEKAW